MESEESFNEDQNNLQELVAEVLARDERTRNDDLWLIIQVWREMGVKVYIPYDDLGKIVAPESITRARRKIQNTEGLWLPTEASVLVRRRVREELMRNYYGSDNVIVKRWEAMRP